MVQHGVTQFKHQSTRKCTKGNAVISLEEDSFFNWLKDK